MATVNQAKELVKAGRTNLQNIEEFLRKSTPELAKALPNNMNPARLNRIVLSLLRMSPKLQDCTPVSVTAAVFQMAQLGLEPIDGQSYIIPYVNSKKDAKGNYIKVQEAQFQIGYKGYISLFYRHQSSVSIFWGVVHENDTFKFDKGQNLLSHTFNLRVDRGSPYAYWVKARLANGAEVFEVMSKTEIEVHAKKHSKSYGTGPWQTDPDAMALKTVLIQLMNLVPKSVEIQRAIAMDETTKSHIEKDMSIVPDETNWNGETIEAEATVKPDEINMTTTPVNGGQK